MARREIKPYQPPKPATAVAAGNGKAGGGGAGSGNDAVIITLSIALGVSLIVVIALVCVYVSKHNGDNTCQDETDVQYVDVDVLVAAEDPAGTVLAASGQGSQVATKPVVLNGPLQNVTYDSVGPAMVNRGTVAAAVDLAATATPTSSSLRGTFKTITADILRGLVEKDAVSIIVVTTLGCGACKALKQSLAEVDASEIHVLDASELKNLPAELREKFQSPYVPQFWSTGKRKVIKGKTGAMPASAILAYIAQQKKDFV